MLEGSIKKIHKEGDIWEEKGQRWTIINGIKENITRFDKIRTAIAVPLSCPECGKAMNSTLDEKLYAIHSKCADCVINMETQMKIAGTFDEYAAKMIKRNQKAHLKEAKSEIQAIVSSSLHKGYVTEFGEVEEWSGSDVEKRMEENGNIIIKALDEAIKSL